MPEKTGWMPNCRQVTRMVSESMDAELPFFRRMAMWVHLMMCRYCFRFRRQILFLRRLSGMDAEEAAEPRAGSSPGLPESARRKLKSVVAEECAGLSSPEEGA